ncbi:MAG: hypothetical protein ABI304_02255, partial [Rudaea sp.]
TTRAAAFSRCGPLSVIPMAFSLFAKLMPVLAVPNKAEPEYVADDAAIFSRHFCFRGNDGMRITPNQETLGRRFSVTSSFNSSEPVAIRIGPVVGLRLGRFDHPW